MSHSQLIDRPPHTLPAFAPSLFPIADPPGAEASDMRAIRLALSRFTGVSRVEDLACITAEIARSVVGAFRVEVHACGAEGGTRLIAESLRGMCAPVPMDGAREPAWPEGFLTHLRHVRVLSLSLASAGAPDLGDAQSRLRDLGAGHAIFAALTQQDRLIGLVVCLCRADQGVAQPLLNMLETLAGMSSLQMVALQQRDILERDRAARAVLVTLMAALQTGRTGSEAIDRHGPDLAHMLQADGCALVDGHTVTSFGVAPEPSVLRTFVQQREDALAKGPLMEPGVPGGDGDRPLGNLGGLDILAVPVVPSATTLLWFRTHSPMAASVADPLGWREIDVECACRIAELWDHLATREHLARTRRRLERETALLVQTNRELDRFAYLASHDLREPLRMVVSYCTLLEQRYAAQLDDSARDFIAFAVDGARRMDHLVDGLLSYSQVTTHGGTFERTPLRPLVERVLEELKGRIDRCGARVHIDAMPTLEVDRNQMILLFSHLIINALTFVASGQRPNIMIRSRKRRDQVDILIDDEGIGISPEFADRIFDLFQRLHTRDQYPGNGLGLTICRRIVTRHGGIIRALPKPVGARFIVTLPVKTFPVSSEMTDPDRSPS
ncbi:MAG: ATP-binding protein [Alphaproteobacteria bacterium]